MYRSQSGPPSGAAEGHRREPSVAGRCQIKLGVPGPSSSSLLSPPGPSGARTWAPDVPLRVPPTSPQHGSAHALGGGTPLQAAPRHSLLQPWPPTTLLSVSGFAWGWDTARKWNPPRCGPWDPASPTSQNAFHVHPHALCVSTPLQSELHGL